jgi:membrane-associated phospholipid phosphatase
MEKCIVVNLQKSPKALFEFMNLISFPFHLKFFIIIIGILYYENLISVRQCAILAIAQIINITIKNIVKRKRPYHENDSIENLEKLKLDYYSFPSGHTLNAFLLFYILRENGIVNNYFKVIPYLVGLSRITLGVHYPTDVIAGALLAKGIMLLSSNWLSI